MHELVVGSCVEPWPRLPFRLGQQPSLLSSSSELLPFVIALLRDPAFSASLTLSCSGWGWQILMPTCVPLLLRLSLRETFLAFPSLLEGVCWLAFSTIYHSAPLLLPPPQHFPHLLPLPSLGPGLSPAQPCIQLFSFGATHARSGSTVCLETGHLQLMGSLALRARSLLPPLNI